MKSIEFKNSAELTSFILSALPLSKNTHRAKDLRKVKSDPIAKGKGVIIWWGNSKYDEVTELRVSTHLKVSTIDFAIDPLIAKQCEFLLKETYLNSKVTIPEIPQEKVKLIDVVEEVAQEMVAKELLIA